MIRLLLLALWPCSFFSFSFFFSPIFIWYEERKKREKGGEGKEKISHPLMYFTKTCDSEVWGMLKPELGCQCGSSCEWQRISCLSPRLLLLTENISKKLELKMTLELEPISSVRRRWHKHSDGPHAYSFSLLFSLYQHLHGFFIPVFQRDGHSEPIHLFSILTLGWEYSFKPKRFKRSTYVIVSTDPGTFLQFFSQSFYW